VRNILAVGVKQDGQVSMANGHVVLIYDERNPAFQKDGKGFIAFIETQQALQEPTMLRKCSWQRIVQHMRNKVFYPGSPKRFNTPQRFNSFKKHRTSRLTSPQRTLYFNQGNCSPSSADLP
jgi:hypothetical protein